MADVGLSWRIESAVVSCIVGVGVRGTDVDFSILEPNDEKSLGQY